MGTGARRPEESEPRRPVKSARAFGQAVLPAWRGGALRSAHLRGGFSAVSVPANPSGTGTISAAPAERPFGLGSET